MPRFQPSCGMFLHIGSLKFEFMPQPLSSQKKETVFVLEGGEAFIYKIRNIETKKLYALKVLKPAYCGKHIAYITDKTVPLSNIPGFFLVRRLCITTQNYPELIKAFPELEYAILMPWVEAPSWRCLLLDQAASERYTLMEARYLALATARALSSLEACGWAHTDIAGGNILLSPDRKRIELLDFEGMYVPGMPEPRRLSRGSPGYQHRHLGPQRQWCMEGDRFAGAILLTEMLTWWEPRVRTRAAEYTETLFCAEELQVPDTPIWQAVRNVLYFLHPDILALFDQAWNSLTLAACPDLATWTKVLVSVLA
ncbi:hypothetical protein EPA93_09635 [Ktedonosporobacter rubrisoli]|uniref:Protein kinase domain-containing protein n=1 Tax=Ktedonosporobacter rubrisoli TaxID=2509675 RepID=A0A4P6JNF4_KTERU|nr:serine/threonine-protein kinase [Ktedonosporobacter rubrisoli]QBD76256.1 hypothetical protein EPA93_09635 [Ktedonosporobacter rubrisoli]